MFTFSDSFWRRLNIVAGLFVVLSTFMLLIKMAHLEIKDLDLWLHIGMGRYIVQHNFHIPSVDILSCTVAGAPWVNHEWLFQVIVYMIYNHWGVEGLIMMQVWLVTITLLLLLFLGYNRKNLFLIVFSLFLVSLVYQSRFTIRPDLFSLFFLALYIAVLGLFIHRKWSVWVLFAIQALWANMHGFFFLGPLIVGMSLLAEYIKRSLPLPWEWNKIGRLTDKEYQRMFLILGLVILACLLTPTGWHGAVYPFKIFTHITGDSKVFFTRIVELQRPITRDTLFSMQDWSYYRMLIIISFLSFIFNRRKIDIGIFFFWLFFLFFSLAAIRNMVFFAFAAYLAFVINIATIRFKDIVPIRFTHKKFLYITSAFAQVLLVVWALRFYNDVNGNGYFDFEKYERKSEFGGVSQRQFPIKATQFLVKNKVRGNFYNDFNSGAYLVGFCYPNIKVFIDGRTEVYGPAFFQYYRDIQESGDVEKFKAALKRFQITGVFLNTVQNPAPESTLNYLYKSPDWTLVYLDYDGLIFLKNTPLNRDVIVHERLDLPTWKPRVLDIYRLGAKQVTPYESLNRAYTLSSLGFDEQAALEARAAIEVNPSYAGPYKILGKIAGKKKDYQAAYDNFRIATVLSSTDQIARMNMALALSDLKKYEEAAIQYRKIIEMWPTSAKAYFRLAKVDIFLKHYDKAYNALSTGYNLDSAAKDDVLELGDMLQENKAYKEARKSYELVLKRQPLLEAPYLRICQVYERTGERSKCIDLLKEGLQKNPESKELKLKLRSLGILYKKQ